MEHNAMSALLLVGGAVMSCHYRQIVETFGPGMWPWHVALLRRENLPL